MPNETQTTPQSIEDAIAVTHRLQWEAKVLARDRQTEPDVLRKQLPPDGDWSILLWLAGRGFGKTAAICETAFWDTARHSGMTFGLIAPTHDSLRKVCFFGKAGLASIIPPECLARPINRSLLEIELWNGSRIVGYSAQEPERLRGPEFDRAACDELAAWKDIDAEEGPWNMLQFCMRGGRSGQPRQYIATTPKPRRVLKELLARDDCQVVRGSSYENRPNLAPSWYRHVISRYEGTRLGRQELGGELLEDVEGALWTWDDLRRAESSPDPALIAVGVDPSGTATGNEAGIVAVGRDASRERGWVLADRSGKLSPAGWAGRAIDLWAELDADAIVVEKNFGGDMCKAIIDQQIRLRRAELGGRRPKVIYVTASRGKRIRAEPVAALYEQGRIEHVPGLDELEAEMTGWDATDGAPSPNRLDAMVWAATHLLVDEPPATSSLGRARVRAA